MNHRGSVVILIGAVVLATLLTGCVSSETQLPQASTPPSGTGEPDSALPSDGEDQEQSATVCPVLPWSDLYAGVSEQMTGLATEPYAPRLGDGVDVVYFRTSTTCDCLAVVRDAVEYALLTYFRDELESGELRYFRISSDAPENGGLMEEFGSDSSDLFVVEYQDGQGVIEQVYAIWSLTGDDEAIVEHVRAFIQAALDRQP